MKISYTDVFEVISKYYPIGIDPFDPLFNDFSGTLHFQELVSNKLEPALFNKWKSIVNMLKKNHTGVLESDYESPLFYPCYSGSIVLEKGSSNVISYKRELFFHLSQLGPYYSVYGLDRAFIHPNTKHAKEFGSILYSSPIEIYEPYFNLVKQKIEESYPGYTFLPNALLTKRVKALTVPNVTPPYDRDATVFQALFTPVDITNFTTYGDLWYE